MVFFKKVEIRELRTKYGGTQRGIFALEPIQKDEKIWFCECGEKDISFTRRQLLNIILNNPKLDYFVRSFSYMIADDIYAIPVTYLEQKNNDECSLFNHSCNPNCGFGDDAFGDNVVACRDINPGEELTYHYGILETESSLIFGMECKCNSIECVKNLTFDYYRDPIFVEKYFNYMTPYLKSKVIDMRSRWYSRDCYVKRLENEDFNDDLVEECETGLFSLNAIKKGDLVASFLACDEIKETEHFLRHSSMPNCILIGRDVFANEDLGPDEELKICYNF